MVILIIQKTHKCLYWMIFFKYVFIISNFNFSNYVCIFIYLYYTLYAYIYALANSIKAMLVEASWQWCHRAGAGARMQPINPARTRGMPLQVRELTSPFVAWDSFARTLVALVLRCLPFVSPTLSQILCICSTDLRYGCSQPRHPDICVFLRPFRRFLVQFPVR